MRHRDDALSAYLDGELAPDEHATVVAHLSGCETCREVLDEVAAARSALRSLPTLELPPGLLGLPARNVIPMRQHRLAWASAAAVAALVTGVTYASFSTPSQTELTPGQLGQVLGAVAQGDENLTPTKIVITPAELDP